METALGGSNELTNIPLEEIENHFPSGIELNRLIELMKTCPERHYGSGFFVFNDESWYCTVLKNKLRYAEKITYDQWIDRYKTLVNDEL